MRADPRPADPWLRTVVALLPCVLGLAFGLHYLSLMAEPNSLVPPFTDANTYLAAGERLAAGHDLYRLSPGDREVLHIPGISDAALLSPPPIAVVWRLIVMVPFGFGIWIVACWIALLGTTFLLSRRSGLRGALLACVLAPAIGEQLAAGNVASFIPGMLVLAWVTPSRFISGLIVGGLAGLKLSPGSVVGWIVASRNWPGLLGFFAAIGTWIIVSIVGAGLAAFPEYLNVIRAAGPSWMSVSGLTGIAWMSPAILVAGTLLSALLGGRPAASFCVGVIASVLGTPALYLSGLVTLLAVLAPMGWPPRAATGDSRHPGESDASVSSQLIGVEVRR
jgi:hypothetical protein